VIAEVALGQVVLRELLFAPAVYHHCSITLFVYMLLLPEERAGEVWEYSENIVIPETGEHWTVKYWHFLHSRTTATQGFHWSAFPQYNSKPRPLFKH
jgi:hypothetical protein